MLTAGTDAAEPVRSARLAYPRDAVRLRDGGDRRLPADRDPELDRAASGQRRSAGAAGRLVAARPDRLSGLGARPAWLAIAADLSFPALLVGVVAREIVAGRNWRNLPMVAPVSVLGIANLLMHLEADGIAVPSGLGWRLGLAAVIVLISVVAGRIVPSFTRNWLAKREASDLPAVHGWVDRAALGTLHAGLFGWAFFPAFSCRSARSFCLARCSICGACCAGAAARRLPSRCSLSFMSATPGWCSVPACSVWRCSMPICRKAPPSTP